MIATLIIWIMKPTLFILGVLGDLAIAIFQEFMLMGSKLIGWAYRKKGL